MTNFPVPARRPWLSSRARLVLVPGLSEGYQLRISRTRDVVSIACPVLSQEEVGARSYPRRGTGSSEERSVCTRVFISSAEEADVSSAEEADVRAPPRWPSRERP